METDIHSTVYDVIYWYSKYFQLLKEILTCLIKNGKIKIKWTGINKK